MIRTGFCLCVCFAYQAGGNGMFVSRFKKRVRELGEDCPFFPCEGVRLSSCEGGEEEDEEEDCCR